MILSTETGNLSFLKYLMVLLMFFLHLSSKAQIDYKSLRMDQNGCNYLVQIDTALLDSAGSYKLEKFSIRGLSKRDTKKLREKMPFKSGTYFLLDSVSILTFNSSFCLVKKCKLEKVQYQYNYYYNNDGIISKDGISIRFAFVKIGKKRK